MDKNSLSHTTWECKYHLVFAPKYRRQVIYGQIKADVAEILSMLCKRKGIEIIEAAFYGAQRPPFCFRTAAFRSQRPPIF